MREVIMHGPRVPERPLLRKRKMASVPTKRSVLRQWRLTDILAQRSGRANTTNPDIVPVDDDPPHRPGLRAVSVEGLPGIDAPYRCRRCFRIEACQGRSNGGHEPRRAIRFAGTRINDYSVAGHAGTGRDWTPSCACKTKGDYIRASCKIAGPTGFLPSRG